jgi:hypothetical protein
MLVGVRLGETSDAPCAVTTWRDQLYLAWTGTDMHINVASSADGQQIAGKQRLAEKSYKRVTENSPHANQPGTNQSSTTKTVALAPALAGSGTRLWLAWTGSDRVLNVLDAEQPLHSGPVTFRERSPESPSLTPAGLGKLAVVWTGTDRHVNLLTVADGPAGAPPRLAGAKSRFDQAKSGHAPAVCGHQGGLALAWTGTDRRINVLIVAEDGPATPVRLEEARSDSAPALCSHQGGLVLAWTGTDRRINVLIAAEDGPSTPVRLDEARSYSAPALCSHQGRLVLAWTGTDRRINLASMQ